jgi:hypothetical protein
MAERFDADMVGVDDCGNNPFTRWGFIDDDDLGNPPVKTQP